MLEEVHGEHHDVTVYCPQVGLSMTLLRITPQVKHHPCVSFFLCAWGEGRQICLLVAEHSVSILWQLPHMLN